MAGEEIGKVPRWLQLDTAAAEHLVKHKISHKPACPDVTPLWYDQQRSISSHSWATFGRSGSDSVIEPSDWDFVVSVISGLPSETVANREGRDKEPD